MRFRLFLVGMVALVALTFWSGWITFSSNHERGSINLEMNEVRHDLQQVQQEGAQLLDDAAEAIAPADRQPTAP